MPVFAALDSLTPDDVMLNDLYLGREPHTVEQALNRAMAQLCDTTLVRLCFCEALPLERMRKTLTVPRGKSEEFNRMSLEERRRSGHPAGETLQSSKKD